MEGKKTQGDDDGSADGEPWVGWVCGGCVKFGQSDQSMRAPYSIIWLPLASHLPSPSSSSCPSPHDSSYTQHIHGQAAQAGQGGRQRAWEGLWRRPGAFRRPHPMLFHELLHGRPISLLPLANPRLPPPYSTERLNDGAEHTQGLLRCLGEGSVQHFER